MPWIHLTGLAFDKLLSEWWVTMPFLDFAFGEMVTAINENENVIFKHRKSYAFSTQIREQSTKAIWKCLPYFIHQSSNFRHANFKKNVTMQVVQQGEWHLTKALLFELDAQRVCCSVVRPVIWTAINHFASHPKPHLSWASLVSGQASDPWTGQRALANGRRWSEQWL